MTAKNLVLPSPLGGAITAIIMLAVVGFTSWRTAQATAILRRGIEHVAVDGGMTVLRSGPARAPLIAPSILRMYGPLEPWINQTWRPSEIGLMK